MGPGVVAVGEREIEYDELVVATGSVPAIPPLEGLGDRLLDESRGDGEHHPGQPDRARKGGAVGVELAQFFRRMGADVTLVEKISDPPPRLDADAGSLLAERFAQDGIRVLVETRADSVVEAVVDGARLHLSSGEAIDAARLLVATGRKPSVEGFGLESLGVEITQRGVTVDDRLSAGDGVWAIGDAAGVGLLTHLGKYQARVAAANIAGGSARVDYRAIPAAVFTDPQVASVGVMDGDGVVTARYEIAGGRLSTYERPRRPGFVKVAADSARRVLVGAVAVGPEAGELVGAAHARRTRQGSDRRPARHDPAVSDVLRGFFNAVLELSSVLDG